MKLVEFTLPLPTQQIQVTISLPEEQVTAFSEYYYPLLPASFDVFVGNMKKDRKKQLQQQLTQDVIDLGRINALFREELSECIGFAKQSDALQSK